MYTMYVSSIELPSLVDCGVVIINIVLAKLVLACQWETFPMNFNFFGRQEAWNSEIKHGVMVRAKDEHVLYFIIAIVFTAKWSNVMDFSVESSITYFYPLATDLATVFVTHFELLCSGCISYDSGCGDTNARRWF